MIAYKKQFNPKYSGMVIWDTPREDSGDLWITASTFRELIEYFVYIMEGKHSMVRMERNPRIKCAYHNGVSITEKVLNRVNNRLNLKSINNE